MPNVETVNQSMMSTDPLLHKQKEDVAKMRASLLCCNDDIYSAGQAIRNITVLRIYHQISRIIKYIEMMDRIEDKMYCAIDNSIDMMDDNDPTTWMTLLTIQEKLQKNMIDSHKLLEPYLNSDVFNIETLSPAVLAEAETNVAGVLTKESRDKLRVSAQQVLAILGPMEEGAVDAGSDN